MECLYERAVKIQSQLSEANQYIEHLLKYFEMLFMRSHVLYSRKCRKILLLPENTYKNIFMQSKSKKQKKTKGSPVTDIGARQLRLHYQRHTSFIFTREHVHSNSQKINYRRMVRESRPPLWRRQQCEQICQKIHSEMADVYYVLDAIRTRT